MFKFKAEYLPLLAAHMANNDVRFYLNGICVEPLANGLGALLVATDGHRLCVIHDQTATADRPHIVSISPGAVRAAAGKKPRRMHLRDRNVEYADGGRLVVIDEVGEEVFVQPGRPLIDGKFPDWRKNFPRTLTPGTGANVYNNAYIATAAEQLARLVPKNRGYVWRGVQFWHDGTKEPGGQILVVGTAALPSVRIIIMPMRDDQIEGVAPFVDYRVALTQAQAYDCAAGLMNRLGAGAVLTDYQMEKVTQAYMKAFGCQTAAQPC